MKYKYVVTAAFFSILMVTRICSHTPFSHELHLEYFSKADGGVSCSDMTLHLHGWGLNGSDVEDLAAILPGTVVTFDLPDAPRDRSSDFKILSKMIPKTSFGQLPEVLVAVRVLREALQRCDPERLFLVGCSRGGSLALNMTYFLLLASGRYAPITRADSMALQVFRRALHRVDVSAEECGIMLDKLLRGGLIMDCPPANINRLFTKQNIRMILPFVLPQTAIQIGLRYMTNYRRDGMQAEYSLARINQLCPELNCLLHLEQFDKVVGGAVENQAFVRALLGQDVLPTCLGIRRFHEGTDPNGHFYDRTNSSLAGEVRVFLWAIATYGKSNTAPVRNVTLSA